MGDADIVSAYKYTSLNDKTVEKSPKSPHTNKAWYFAIRG